MSFNGLLSSWLDVDSQPEVKETPQSTPATPKTSTQTSETKTSETRINEPTNKPSSQLPSVYSEVAEVPEELKQLNNLNNQGPVRNQVPVNSGQQQNGGQQQSGGQQQNSGQQQSGEQQMMNRAQRANNPQFEFDRYFLSWLREQRTGFIISSYKTHKVFSLGYFIHQTQNQGAQAKLSLWISHFNRPMGVHTTKDTVWVSSSGNMWKFENSGEWTSNIEEQGKFDANYIPRLGYFSNDIDTHDICIDKDGNPYYCSAMFSCVCVPSSTHSFKVYWKPPWIDKISPEDRCHLNGICSRDGVPRYITAVCRGNVKGAWREQRIGHGVAYDIVEDKVVCEGLTMPHSPRWFKDKLWILEAGTGYFGYVENGEFVRKVFLPGYLRGLCFVNDRYAIVGSSQDRHEQSFQGLPLGEKLQKEGITAKCGFYVIDLYRDFSIIHSLTFQSPVDELYDICAIKGVVRPKLSDIGDDANLREFLIDYGDTSTV